MSALFPVPLGPWPCLVFVSSEYCAGSVLANFSDNASHQSTSDSELKEGGGCLESSADISGDFGSHGLQALKGCDRAQMDKRIPFMTVPDF